MVAPLVLGAGISAGASLLGGLMGNRANARSARQQQQWQEHMRATQYQTAVSDLKAAGLNPMLAYSQGGAGTPQGAQATPQDVLSPAVKTGISTAQALASVENVKADTENKKASAAQIEAQTNLLWDQASVQRALRLLTEHQSTSAGYHALQAPERSKYELRKLLSETQISEAGVPGAQAEAKLYETAGAGLSGALKLQQLLPLFRALLGDRK